MTGPHKTPDQPHHGRHDRGGLQQIHDPYVARLKPTEPSVCSDCGVVWHEGRWQWLARPANAQELRCPACQRVHDRVPAGYLTLGGTFLAAHRQEIAHLIDHHAERQAAEHPLKRIMAREETADGLLITTTDAHLARGLGEAIHDAYKGDIDYHYVEDDATLRVRWSRDA